MTSKTIGALAGMLLLASVQPARAAETPNASNVSDVSNVSDIRDVLGASHAGGKYNFTEEDYLNEGADRLLELGTRVIKLFLNPAGIESAYSFNSDWAPLPTDVVDLAQRPYFQELFAKPFSAFFLVVPPVTVTPQFLDGMTPEEIAGERDQMYRLAKHLLSTYAGTGKTFVLQNWEGDHLLRSGLNGATPDAVRLRGMTDWWNARQDGVRQARQEVGAKGVEVFHAVEVNNLSESMAGKVTATNDIVPYTRADLYSYSSWEIAFDRKKMTAALDHLEKKAPDNNRFGKRNLYLGELGMAKDHGPEGQRAEKIRGLMETALGWGVRWALYWQVYCNEAARVYSGRPGNRDMRGFWLIRPDGVKAKMWEDFAAQLPASLVHATFGSYSGQYMSVDERGGGEVTAERWTRTGASWSTFALKDWNGGALASGDEVSLQAHDGLYLSVQPGSGGRVHARGSAAGRQERFLIRRIGAAGPIEPGDGVAFETSSGRYLGAEVGGRGAVRALRPAPGPAEVFVFALDKD
jgi:hypothetical protein